ncbi:transposase [Hymenobacter glacieicola]|nr:transposase [Hymenobacter glacieicola]
MDNGLYQDKYRVASTRWRGYDYSQNGVYFITICTQNRHHYFGQIQEGVLPGEEAVLLPTQVGLVALECWKAIPQHFPFAVPDVFVVMPDHIHGIIFFHRPTTASPSQNTFGPQSQNLASVVRGFKVGVKSWATRNQWPFAWQAGYFDRVIRNEAELEKARRYIANNPSQWTADQGKPDGVFR